MGNPINDYLILSSCSSSSLVMSLCCGILPKRVRGCGAERHRRSVIPLSSLIATWQVATSPAKCQWSCRGIHLRLQCDLHPLHPPLPKSPTLIYLIWAVASRAFHPNTYRWVNVHVYQCGSSEWERTGLYKIMVEVQSSIKCRGSVIQNSH